MTQPTPQQLDQNVADAMHALAVAWQASPQDPAAIAQARANLVAARQARGYA